MPLMDRELTEEEINFLGSTSKNNKENTGKSNTNKDKNNSDWLRVLKYIFSPITFGYLFLLAAISVFLVLHVFLPRNFDGIFGEGSFRLVQTGEAPDEIMGLLSSSNFWIMFGLYEWRLLISWVLATIGLLIFIVGYNKGNKKENGEKINDGK